MGRATRRRMERVRRKYVGSLLRALTGPSSVSVEGSAVVWEGPSMIDGEPTIVIVTGLKPGASKNSKTDDMVQSFILRSDVDPVTAVQMGLDFSICGYCQHRGTPIIDDDDDGPHQHRSCYVAVGKSVIRVYGTWENGRYQDVSPVDVGRICAEFSRPFRCGTYGDPAAVPLSVWKPIVSRAAGHTGYTHQWRMFPERAAGLSRLFMASCETIDDYRDARSMGYRTFSSTPGGRLPIQGEETICPASEEAGKRSTCASCMLCGGTAGMGGRLDSVKSIVINPHGFLVGNLQHQVEAGVV